MNQVTLGQWTSIDPKRNRFRYYRVSLTEDLWKNPCLVKSWGRIGQAPRRRYYWPKADEDLAQLLRTTILRREKRGYRIGSTSH